MAAFSEQIGQSWIIIEFLHQIVNDQQVPYRGINHRFLSGCPRKNRPLNFDQIFDFLQTFCTRQGRYRTNENTFRLLVIFSVPEILRQMLSTPGAPKIALSSSRN